MRYRGAFLLSGGYRRASRERVAHVGQGLREEGNGVPEMAGPLLGDARSAPALGMFFVVPETYQCGTACNCDDTETARPQAQRANNGRHNYCEIFMASIIR